MANISAKDVMALRQKTGIGMMECKKALISAQGDFEEAVKILREKGLAVAAKKAGRVAAEGIVGVSKCDECGLTAMVEVNCETDFVAKNASFNEFVQSVLGTIIKTKPKNLNALLAEKLDGSELTIEDEIKDKIFTIGENISVRRFALVAGVTGYYVHMGGSAGVITAFETTNGIETTEAFAEYAKNICMQIAAMNPLYVCKHCVPANVIEGEKEILLAQIKGDPKMANRPEAIIEKMVSGRINKFYETNCLKEQQYVKDEGKTVDEYTKSVARELGGDIVIVDFIKYERGEGIEKAEEDFAAEIDKLIQG
ncbi:MAG: translation elongation factor Ts [Eubacteriales bacterium]